MCRASLCSEEHQRGPVCCSQQTLLRGIPKARKRAPAVPEVGDGDFPSYYRVPEVLRYATVLHLGAQGK